MQGAWSLGEKNIASKWNLMLCFSSFPEAAIFPVRFEWINHLLILEATESTHPPPLPFLNFSKMMQQSMTIWAGSGTIDKYNRYFILLT